MFLTHRHDNHRELSDSDLPLFILSSAHYSFVSLRLSLPPSLPLSPSIISQAASLKPYIAHASLPGTMVMHDVGAERAAVSSHVK